MSIKTKDVHNKKARKKERRKKRSSEERRKIRQDLNWKVFKKFKREK